MRLGKGHGGHPQATHSCTVAASKPKGPPGMMVDTDTTTPPHTHTD